MNGGYQMIDFEGFDISSSESKKIVGISDKLNYAREHGKMILCYRLKNSGVYVNANPTAVDENGNLYFDGLAVVLNVVTTGDNKDTVSVVSNVMQSIINGGAKNFCPVNSATLASAGYAIAENTSVSIPVGEYVLSFAITQGMNSSIRYVYRFTFADGTNTYYPSSSGGAPNSDGTLSKKITFSKAVTKIQLYIGGTFTTSVIVSNIMIRPSYANADYVAYSPTNAELNARVYALEHPAQQSKNGEGVFQTEEEPETKTTRKKS